MSFNDQLPFVYNIAVDITSGSLLFASNDRHYQLVDLIFDHNYNRASKRCKGEYNSDSIMLI